MWQLVEVEGGSPLLRVDRAFAEQIGEQVCITIAGKMYTSRGMQLFEMGHAQHAMNLNHSAAV